MKICSYFGNRWIDTYRDHMEEIAEHGFDSILHPISEQDLAFDTGQVQRLIQETKDAGFTCWVDPHGIGRVFGYGSISTYDAEQSTGVFITQMELFLDMTDGADWVLWDEVDVTKPLMRHTLPELFETAHSKRMKNSICLWGSSVEKNRERIEICNSFSGLDDFGPSFTPLGLEDHDYIHDWLDVLKDVKKQTSVWIPGYQISSDKERFVKSAVEDCGEAGVDNIGHWGFRGCEAMFYRSEDPELVWDVAGQAFRNLL